MASTKLDRNPQIGGNALMRSDKSRQAGTPAPLDQDGSMYNSQAERQQVAHRNPMLAASMMGGFNGLGGLVNATGSQSLPALDIPRREAWNVIDELREKHRNRVESGRAAKQGQLSQYESGQASRNAAIPHQQQMGFLNQGLAAAQSGGPGGPFGPLGQGVDPGLIARAQNANANRIGHSTHVVEGMYDRFGQQATEQRNRGRQFLENARRQPLMGGGSASGVDPQSVLEQHYNVLEGGGESPLNIMRKPDGSFALTSRGNMNRPGGPISSEYNSSTIPVTVDGRTAHIDSQTAPEYQDIAARNKLRIQDRIEEKGGVSDRELRRLRGRAATLRRSVDRGILSADDAAGQLEDVAGDRGLLQAPKVNSIIDRMRGRGGASGRSGSSSYKAEDAMAPSSGPRTVESQRTTENQLVERYNSSPRLQSIGLEPGGGRDAYIDKLDSLIEDGTEIDDSTLGEIASQLFGEEHIDDKFFSTAWSTTDQNSAKIEALKRMKEAKTEKERRAAWEEYKRSREISDKAIKDRRSDPDLNIPMHSY